jgi:asparagine synthase (glutamine-hydrolysing)
MRPLYLLVAGEGGAAGSELVARLMRRTGLALALDQPGLTLLVNPHCPWLGAGGHGCIVGTLFHRHGRARPVESLDAHDMRAIAASRGDSLLRSFWGGYVAAVAGPDGVRILRDPSAALSCYFTQRSGLAIFASDAELLVEAGLVRAEMDWDALARHLFGAGVPAAETALRGVSELLPGLAVELRAGLQRQTPCWSPWDHVGIRAEEAEAAAGRLREVILRCVRAWAAGRGRLLLSLSGGLDSSILAAALADAGADTACLTLHADDPDGDERPYARAVAQRLGLPLVERAYRIGDVDIKEPLGTHLPRPRDRSQAIAYERAHVETAGEVGARAFVTGNGGDCVFGYSHSAAPVADLYLDKGFGPGLFRALRDVSLQTGCSFGAAAAGAWRIARGPARYRCRPDPLFLAPDLVERLSRTEPDHPWLDAPSGALPGKAAHVASILRVLSCLEPSRSRFLPVLNPLLSQPVVETCLAVPTWQWRAGGRDRALARRAFEQDLPEAVLRRRVKGGPGGFAAQLLDHFRPAIRERLLGGHLASHSILDLRALESALADERPRLGGERVWILELVAAEAWLDHWLARSGP